MNPVARQQMLELGDWFLLLQSAAMWWRYLANSWRPKISLTADRGSMSRLRYLHGHAHRSRHAL
jgi:hypothetical protein